MVQTMFSFFLEHSALSFIMLDAYDSLLQQLKTLCDDEIHDNLDETKRQQLMLYCRKASLLLESPFESMQRVVYSVSLVFILS